MPDEPLPAPAVGADALIGLLADERRLQVVAALVLGAADEAGVAATTGLDERSVRTALDRLVRGTLVERTGGGLRVATERLQEVARWTAAHREHVTPEDLGATPEQSAILRNFLHDGRLSHLPASRAKRMAVLDFLAGRFEPGVVYPERDVNFMLGRFHADYAALRRALIDEGFLERRDAFYWRAGGTVDVE